MSVQACSLTFKLSAFHVPFWFPGTASSLGHSHVRLGPHPSWTQPCTCSEWILTASLCSSPWALLSAQNQLEFLGFPLAVGEHSGRTHRPELGPSLSSSTFLGHWPHPLSYCREKFQMEASHNSLYFWSPTWREIHYSPPALGILPEEVGARPLYHVDI